MVQVVLVAQQMEDHVHLEHLDTTAEAPNHEGEAAQSNQFLANCTLDNETDVNSCSDPKLVKLLNGGHCPEVPFEFGIYCQ